MFGGLSNNRTSHIIPPSDAFDVPETDICHSISLLFSKFPLLQIGAK